MRRLEIDALIGLTEVEAREQVENAGGVLRIAVNGVVTADFNAARVTVVVEGGRVIEDVAWDAVAMVPLASKPSNFVVALGDSYASGEGADNGTFSSYYRETDVNGDDSTIRNACHRSRDSWGRLSKLPGSAATVGARSDSTDASLDYHLPACSGAKTEQVLGSGDLQTTTTVAEIWRTAR